MRENSRWHDLYRSVHGTYLSLSYQTVEIEDFPTSDTDPDAPTQTAMVRDEPVVEFLPDGKLRRVWPLTEMLDPTRIAFDSLTSTNVGLDWVHVNAVIYRPSDDSIVVSARHQDAVFKFSRATGELQWILGPHDNWGPEFQQYLLAPVGSPFAWNFHQHAPMWVTEDRILFFDNGNHRASPFDGTTPVEDSDNYSRAVEYEIDEKNMLVRQVWEYGEGATPEFFSRFISDADLMPLTGNRLIDFGGTVFVDGVSSEDLGKHTNHVRIVETTDDIVPVKVFDLEVSDPAGRVGVYRAERIPDLYPEVYVSDPNGVGNTLIVDRVSAEPSLAWNASPIDVAHSAADHYMVYRSSSPNEDFVMVDSTSEVTVDGVDDGSPLQFYKIVAANLAGTSGDEPPLAP